MSKLWKITLAAAMILTGSTLIYAADDAAPADAEAKQEEPAAKKLPVKKEKNPFERDIQKLKKLEKEMEDASDKKAEKIAKKMEKIQEKISKKCEKETDKISKQIEKLDKKREKEKNEAKQEAISAQIAELEARIERLNAWSMGEDPYAEEGEEAADGEKKE